MLWKQVLRVGAVNLALIYGAFVPSGLAQTATPDNTRANQRDRSKAEPTADQAKENKSDRQMMQEIRKAVVGDKSLSTYAHNVKIIAQNGKVTLKGPVRSAEEKKAIEAKAVGVAGEGNVTDRLTIKAGGESK